MSDWQVACEPIKHQGGGKKLHGLGVYLMHYTQDEKILRFEVGRVAYNRENSENPNDSFSERLDQVWEKAEEVRDTISGLEDELERVREEKRQEASDKLYQVLKDVGLEMQ